MKYLIPLLLLFSCTTGELEQVYNDFANAKISAVCDEIDAANGLTLDNCVVKLGGEFTEDTFINSTNGAGIGIQSSGGTKSAQLILTQDHMELYNQDTPFEMVLSNSPWTINGLGPISGTDRVWVSNGFLKLGTPSPLNNQGVSSGSVLGQNGPTVTVNITSLAAQNSSYKVTITPTSLNATTPYFVSGKTSTSFTVTYVTAINGVSFDWIITP